MNNQTRLLLLLCSLPLYVLAQSDHHYSMFMYNKLLYNPGYTGSREVTAMNMQGRWQWPNVQGNLGQGGSLEGVKTMNITVDAPVGSYMKPERKVAVGLSASREISYWDNNTDLKAYYAYRIKLQRSVLSLGLSAGAMLYSSDPNNITVFQSGDPSFAHEIKNALLPNAGVGAYWSGERFYVGLSVPTLVQNKYDPKSTTTGAIPARQIRAYYLSGGYVFRAGDDFKLRPQLLVRYAKNAYYALPLSADINVSATAYDRVMAGISYRTGGALIFLVQVQATTRFNIGYAYDYVTNDLGRYTKGAHEVVIGFEFNHERTKFTAPRFSKAF